MPQSAPRRGLLLEAGCLEHRPSHAMAERERIKVTLKRPAPPDSSHGTSPAFRGPRSGSVIAYRSLVSLSPGNSDAEPADPPPKKPRSEPAAAPRKRTGPSPRLEALGSEETTRVALTYFADNTAP